MSKKPLFEIVSVARSAFAILCRDEAAINALTTSEQPQLILNNKPVTLPPVDLLTTEQQQDGRWLVSFTCRSVADNKACFWLLRCSEAPAAVPFTSTPLLSKRHLYAYSEQDKQKRVTFLHQHTGHLLTHAADTTLVAEQLKKNIEGFVGSVEIPVGIAGPLRINGERASGIFYAPVATTEGALIASISRGASAITQSGGANVQVLEQRMMRVPRFEFSTIKQCALFVAWAEDHLETLRHIITHHSRFARLLKFEPHIIGNAVHLAFVYTTAEAAGQNMTTVCTWHACQWIKEHLPDALQPQHFILESNLSSDKKCSWQTFSQGRGTRVIAEATLSEQACHTLLRLTPEALVNAWRWLSEGSTAAGMTGMNVNTANVIAGMFTALGQDIACSHESALAQLQMTLTPDNSVYCTMTLPALIIGTVGGGTALPAQADYLRLLGCEGSDSTSRLAEIIAGFCLALDISTLAALANDEFARSHQLLGRRKKSSGHAEVIDPLADCILHADWTTEWQAHPPVSATRNVWHGNENSILTAHCDTSAAVPVGIFSYTLRDEEKREHKAIIKSKPATQAIMEMLYVQAERCSPTIAQHLRQVLPLLEFNHARERETALLQQTAEQFTRHVPKLYGIFQHKTHGQSIVIEEQLVDESMLNSFQTASRWQPEHISAALGGIAEIHALWYQQEAALTEAFPMITPSGVQTLASMTPLCLEIATLIHRQQPELFPAELFNLWHALIDSDFAYWHETEAMPRTLVHNDFSPRNIAFRQADLRLCCWDWELAALHLPQRDLVELLTYTLNEDVEWDDVQYWITFHRQALERARNTAIDPRQWQQGYRLALYDFGFRRLSLYLMFNYISPLPWFPPVMKTYLRLVSLAQDMCLPGHVLTEGRNNDLPLFQC